MHPSIRQECTHAIALILTGFFFIFFFIFFLAEEMMTRGVIYTKNSSYNK